MSKKRDISKKKQERASEKQRKEAVLVWPVEFTGIITSGGDFLSLPT